MSTDDAQDVVYDDFLGPQLDWSRWKYLEYSDIPDGPWRCEEPSAETAVHDGQLSIQVATFQRAHDGVPIMDNPKHMLISTATFSVPPRGRISVATELAVTNINAAAHDYRDGFASLNVIDMATGMVFDSCATADHLFAIHEQLPVPGAPQPFTFVVENALHGPVPRPGTSHRHHITLDAANRTAEWHLDGNRVYATRDIAIPPEVTIGLGLCTLHRIEEGQSRSLRGQGISAVFGPIHIRTQF